jgi:hypothetical protein
LQKKYFRHSEPSFVENKGPKPTWNPRKPNEPKSESIGPAGGKPMMEPVTPKSRLNTVGNRQLKYLTPLKNARAVFPRPNPRPRSHLAINVFAVSLAIDTSIALCQSLIFLYWSLNG